MADTINFKWNYGLIEYNLSKYVSNDYTAYVNSNGSIGITDIAKSIAAERTDLRADTIVMVLNLAKEKVMEQVCMGNTVVFGGAIYQPLITGTFTGNTGALDSTKNQKKVSITATAEFRKQLQDVTLNFTGTVKDLGGARIRLVTDTRTKNTSGTITPGGGMLIEGTKIKCLNSDGSDYGVIRFVNVETAEETVVTDILTNEPKKVQIIIPSTLTAGSYTLQIETYFSNSSLLLKSERVIKYDLTLTVEGATGSSESESATDESSDSSDADSGDSDSSSAESESTS